MNLNEIEAKCFIMALFIRDDGLRFLLGSGAYEFKDSQLMFAGNTIENDVVSVQGNDGYMLAGQVRRPNTQVFDGYIGDASVSKSEVEGYRRDFMAFFQKNHFYTVVYVMADGSAIQRRRGFLVDAPTSQELWQMYPEYHVALNFEDVNYYRYSENDDGEETYAKSADIGLAKVQYGGLIWDNNSEIEISGTGTNITLAGTMEGGAIESVELNGDTEQQTYSGKNLAKITDCDASGSGYTLKIANNTVDITSTGTNNWFDICLGARTATWVPSTSDAADYHLTPADGGTYTVKWWDFSGTSTSTGYNQFCVITNQRFAQRYYWNGQGSNPTTATFTLQENEYVKMIGVWTRADTTATISYKVQLERSSTATSFEPYVGGTASPNPDYPQEVQTVTGEQTVTVVGKNLLNESAMEQGIFSYIDGYESAHTGVIRMDSYMPCQPNTTYTLSSDSVLGEIGVVYKDSSGNVVQGFSKGAETITSYSFTTKSNVYQMRVRVGKGAYPHTAGVDYKLQLELGNQPTSYQPYQGGSYPINLGKNLYEGSPSFDSFSGISAWEDGGTYNGMPVIKRAAAWSGAYRLININAGITYTFSSWVKSDEARQVAIYAIGSGATATISPNNKTITTSTSWERVSFTFTCSTSGTIALRFENTSASTTNYTYISGYQLELGSTATTYAPYFTPIELCKIGTYQDYIYKSGENWYVHKELGEFNLADYKDLTGWYVTGGGEHCVKHMWANNFPITDIKPQPNMTSLGYGLSNYFTEYNYADLYNGAEKVGFAFGLDGIYLSDNDWTLASFRTWITGKVVNMYYIKTTPTDTQITNAALIAQLEALNSATTYSGATYITVSGDLASPLEITVTSIGGGGVVWDENGAEWEAGGGGEIVIVNVDSIENILPVWTIRGEAENPTLTNLTTGMSITYNGTVASGQTLVIDLLNKTAKLNGTSVISDVSGQWVEFKPGNNRVSYSTENANAPDSTIEWQEVVG